MKLSDTTILRLVRKSRSALAPLRIVGIDEWAWRKGATFGTIIVDLERHQVVDVLTDRSTANTADWLRGQAGIEVVSRDRAGLYADAARQGAPGARQVADRFHLLKNLRETIERQLGRFEAPIRHSAALPENGCETPEKFTADGPDICDNPATFERKARHRRAAARQAQFAEIRSLYEAGDTVAEIARKLGLGRRRIYRWVRRIDLPEPSVMAPKPGTPDYFGAFIRRRWDEGMTKVRHLFTEIRNLGYTGSYSHLARYLAPWRAGEVSNEKPEDPHLEQEALAAPFVRTLDPMTGRQISPLTAAALCVKPRGQMTARQITNVDALKSNSEEFATMRRLAMRFRGLLRSGTGEKLDAWLDDAHRSGIYGMRRFVRTLRQDIEAVRNAILEPWSNGQTEGQINKLKTLKRAMYGRANIDLLRARMMPI